MPRPAIPSYYFAFVVVRRGDRFLLVQERKYDNAWYLPAGRIEPGETILDAARRETLEESGIPIAIDGLLRIEHSPRPDGTRVRIFFTGHPIDDTPPKSIPDDESLGAAWVSLADLPNYPLRGDEVPAILTYVANGGATYPLSLLTTEAAPW